MYAGNPDRDRIIRRYDERAIYRDARGEYHWQVIERELWFPEQRIRTVWGSRVIPGHYEVRHQRIKVYHRSGRYNNYRYNDRTYQYKGKNGHPNGMPPGQWKKQDDRYDRDREDDCKDRDRRYDDREYDGRRTVPGRVQEENRPRRGD